MVLIPIGVSLGVLLAWALTGLFICGLDSWGWIDRPNPRSAHQRPTPRGGGLAFIVAAICVSLLLAGAADHPAAVHASSLLLLSLPLALVGLVDDRLSLPASWRYFAQIFTALLLLHATPLPIPGLAWPLLLMTVTAVINFTNFMDGLDGLVAGCMAVALGASALQLAAPLPLWGLVGALLGFLIWNWSPAKVFMGDVGSTFLGAVFAGAVLQASAWTQALGLLLVATPLLGDACMCVLRRLLAGQRIWQAHRLHLFQRLHQGGWPHGRVSALYIAATALLAIALQLGGWRAVLPLALLEMLVGIVLDQRVALPFALACQGAEEAR
jgi:Fuc2NAc and GlcNAc transferase